MCLLELGTNAALLGLLCYVRPCWADAGPLLSHACSSILYPKPCVDLGLWGGAQAMLNLYVLRSIAKRTLLKCFGDLEAEPMKKVSGDGLGS